ncbi:MAG TPA: SAM-dependent methyltransferase [Bacillales bacterium]|nr:SAM-dependent methyltransferase [Bacillales bacterium]
MKKLVEQLIRSSPEHRIDMARYMETVLYHETEGYYRKTGEKIGRQGDFYTSASMHPVFGKVLAECFIEWCSRFQIQPSICELGAGGGTLAASVIEHWQATSRETFADLHYYVIEGSPYHRELIKKRIPGDGPLVVFDSLEAFVAKHRAFDGIFLSNEFFDALPVRVVENDGEALKEIAVTINEYGKLCETVVPLTDPTVVDWIDRYGYLPEKGQRIEIPIAMTEVLDQITASLKRGLVLTFDYGFTEKEAKHPSRRRGTLRGYYRHQLIGDVLAHPGNMDLTFHVPLDAYRKIMSDRDMMSVWSGTQRQFLLKNGIRSHLRQPEDTDPFSDARKQNRAVFNLISEAGMGHAFSVLLHKKKE